DEEVMLAVIDEEFTAVLDRHFDEDTEVSVEMRAARYRRRSWLQRGREALVVPIRRFL
ncbi:cardiolipin synthase B, partial [Streptomyces albidoflavus]